MKTPRLGIRIAFLYGVTIVGILGGVWAFERSTDSVTSSAAPLLNEERLDLQSSPERKRVSAQPVALEVPAVDISLAVKPGLYDETSQQWTLDAKSAFFATSSALPGTTPGITFLYGHNRDTVFAPLSGLKVGEEAILTLVTGDELVYRFSGERRVPPTATEVLSEPSQTPQLALLTCEGFFNELRRVMYFKLEEIR